MRISNSSTLMSSTLAPRAAASVALGKKMEMLIHMTSDTWDPKTNPDGYINLGVAENYLVKDILAKKLNETFHITPPAIGYGTGPWGSPKLRERFTTLLNKYFHPSSHLKEDNVIFGCGVTALSEALGFTLLGEGDALLLNRPIYGAFFQDFTIRAGNKMIDVAMKGADVFGPGAVEKFEEELIEARKRGINVRVLLLCNPHNPLGASLTKKQLARVLDRSISSFALEDPELLQTTTCARHELMTKPTGKCYSPDILRAYMRLCQKYKIHLVSDEVYGLTVFETDNKDAVPFTSVLSLEGEGLIDKNYLHVLYGMSKDFASNGIRLGCVITRNEELRRALYTLGLFQWATGPSSVAAEGMLEDEKWVEDFLQLSREKIADSYRFITKFFDDEGINYYRGQNAGFFLWTDFSPFLPEVTAECSSGVERERVLLQRIFKAGVFVGSGEEFHSEEPGWIRISFTNDRTSLTEGLKRLVAVARGKNVEKEALTQAIGSIAL